ncbi:MAG: DUF4278 domain-containing protein [Moorea sp. SIO4A1]|nr:DUF4278 domain-containing protein [Moorena sp. SIO4A5]NEQ59868.1 DUF4278 domain-containing protein [Moorena sp. SIO4A1]
MKLRYRGLSYDVQPSLLEVTEGEIGGIYRGQNWRYNYPKYVAKSSSVNPLTYPESATPNFYIGLHGQTWFESLQLFAL